MTVFWNFGMPLLAELGNACTASPTAAVLLTARATFGGRRHMAPTINGQKNNVESRIHAFCLFVIIIFFFLSTVFIQNHLSSKAFRKQPILQRDQTFGTTEQFPGTEKDEGENRKRWRKREKARDQRSMPISRSCRTRRDRYVRYVFLVFSIPTTGVGFVLFYFSAENTGGARAPASCGGPLVVIARCGGGGGQHIILTITIIVHIKRYVVDGRRRNNNNIIIWYINIIQRRVS